MIRSSQFRNKKTKTKKKCKITSKLLKELIKRDLKSIQIIQWHEQKILVVTSISFFGGLLSSIVGVGGGIIFSPLLVSLNMPPTVAVSTAIFVETFMVLTTTVQYLITNVLYT